MSSIMTEDWIEVEIGEVANIYNGNSINAQVKEKKYKNLKDGYNYIGTKDVAFDAVVDYENGVKIPFENESFKIAPKGCVLVCSEGGSAGRKTAYIEQDICFGNKLYAITDEFNILEGKYVFYYSRFRKFFDDFKNQMNGIIGGVSTNKFAEITFPLAPLPIQRAIISKTEELFSDLDNGIANFKKAQEQLKIYRQAVLKKAFEGELTKVWREKQTNLPTAEALLKQIKEERQNHYNQQIEDWKKAVKVWEKNKQTGKKPSKPTQPKELPPLQKEDLEELSNLPTGWKWEKIGLNFLSLDQGWSPKCENYPAKIEEWGVIKTTAVQANSFEEINNKKLPLKLSPRIQHELVKGDILITRAGPRNRVGVCCLVNNVRSKLINCDKVYRIKAIVSNPTFIVYMLNSPAFSKELEKTKSGISDSGVNLKQDVFFKMPVPLCSLQEQNQIVQEIEFRLSVCDKMEQSIIESIEKAEVLRQSILKKAFEGRLLSQAEIELCKTAADYEPASELLKKIQAEKLAKEQEKKKPIVKKKSKK